MTFKDVFILALNVERVREIRPARTLHPRTPSGLAYEGRAQIKRDEVTVHAGSLKDRTTRG